MSAAYFWPADQAQIYQSLKTLVAEGAVELTVCMRGVTVDKKLYAITDKGRETLHTWISSPKHSDFISRLPFLMQLFFSGTLSCEEQLEFLDKQLKLNHELLKSLRDSYE